jgi:hypothetical protein
MVEAFAGTDRAKEPMKTWRKQPYNGPKADEVTFNWNPHNPWHAELRYLHALARQFIIWTIDVEFVSLRVPWNAVPMQISVRNLWTDVSILTCQVDYGSMSLNDMQELIGPFCNQNVFPPAFAKNYHSDRTKGLSLGAIGKKLLESGFNSETHRIISHFCSTDKVAFLRALRGDCNVSTHFLSLIGPVR